MSVRSAAPPPSSKVDVPGLPSGWQSLGYTILVDGVLAVIGTDVDLASEWLRIRGAPQELNPPSEIRELAASGAAQIWTLGSAGWAEGPTFPLDTPFPIIDRFDDGRWLVVGARTRVGTNARVLSEDGDVLDRFMLGDGIGHAVIDQFSRIWVGWFDEGIFGNDEWRVPGLDWPPSANGVACFAEDGALVDLPEWPTEAGSIGDCYALNAVGDGSWSCTYVDFPLVHRVPGNPVRWWRNTLAGASALATSGAHVLLAGGYGSEADRLTLLAVDGIGQGEDARAIARWGLPLRERARAEEGEPAWEHPTLLVGRGDAIHLIEGDVWRTWRVSALAPPVVL